MVTQLVALFVVGGGIHGAVGSRGHIDHGGHGIDCVTCNDGRYLQLPAITCEMRGSITLKKSKVRESKVRKSESQKVEKSSDEIYSRALLFQPVRE